MALVDTSKSAFSSGELSPRMLARQDVDRYKNAALELLNWQVLPQGGVRKRAGTRYIATEKDVTKLVRLMPFEPSSVDAYILETGHEYMRFYTQSARIESPPGTPVEVATPYQDIHLRMIRTAQSNDVMILVHPQHAPRRLSRLSHTSWVFSPISFSPPPTYEAGHTSSVTLTLSATSGTSVTVTASAPFFLPADVQRQLVSGVGRGIITAYTDSTHVTMTVLDTFASTTLSGGSWEVRGSPVADLLVSAAGPVSREVTVTLAFAEPTGSNLVTDGDFPSLTNWTDLSRPTVVSGTHSGANNSTFLITSADLFGAGVRATQLITNSTDNSVGTVASIGAGTLFVAAPGMLGGAENDFDTGDSFTVTATGGASVSGGVAYLFGGTAGYGWIEQLLTVTAGVTYEIFFRVVGAAVAMMVGASSGASDLLSEVSYAPGGYKVRFTASGANAYLGFRNNQNYQGGVTNVIAQAATADGFRAEDVGKYVRAHAGLILLRTFVSAHEMRGEILRELSSTDTVAAGAWSLESSSWSDALGWPSEVLLYEGRLYFFSSARFPKTVWGSAVDDLFNFGTGPNPADALEYTLVNSGGNITLDAITWAMPAENLLYGTTHGLYRLVGSGDDPLTPTNLPRNRAQDAPGSAFIKPVKIGGALLYTQRRGSSVWEVLLSDNGATTFNATDITITSDHLFRDFAPVEISYKPEPGGEVLVTRADGYVPICTYNRREEVRAWWRFVTNGIVESAAIIPDAVHNAHQVWLSVRRLINGVTTRWVEVIDPYAVMPLPTPVSMVNGLTQETETVTQWQGLTVDGATVYTGVNTSTLTGLDRFEGQLVFIVADGAVFPPQVVSGGQVVLSQAVHGAFVGLGYSALGKTVPVDVPLRGTTGQLARKRWVKVRVRVEQTLSLIVHGERVFSRQPHMPMGQGAAPFSGDKDIVPLGWSGHGVITFVADEPLPSTILGIYGLLDSEAQQ